MANHHEFSRADRVRKAMMREVSDIISSEVKDPRLSGTLISVTDVEITHDLRSAKIFLSILGTPEVQAQVMEILQEAQPKIRAAVGQRIRLRFTPEISLKFDDSLERGSRVSHLLDQISRGEV